MNRLFPPDAARVIARGGYRADIDGLRGIAVAAVVLFHAFPAILPGGFVGVDIFFVISGFLISRLLADGIKAGTFRPAAFYARRVRRLFPALAVLLIAVLIAGWFVLLPDEFRQLGKQAAAGAGFVSNFAFLNESGYFDTAAVRKPLLHLWSLGIEEQFYLTWPFMLPAALKLRRGPLSWIAAGASLSFILNLALHGHPAMSWYLPLTRFWEIWAGSALVFLDTRVALLPPPARSKMSLTGFLFLAIALVIPDSKQPYPGYAAVLPVAGACLTILAGEAAWINRWTLRARPLVFLGLISYPLYLWHWSLFSFARILGWADAPQIAFLSFTAFVLAWLTWRWVELPVRWGIPRRSMTPWITAVALAAVGGLVIFATNGIVGRPQSAIAASELTDIHAEINARRCSPAPPAFQICFESRAGRFDAAVLGDSHALVLRDGLAAADPSRNWLAVGNPSCPPVVGVLATRPDRPPCGPRTEAAIDYLSRSGPRLVIVSFFGYSSETTNVAADYVNTSGGPGTFRLESAEPRVAGLTDKEDALLAGLRNTARILLAQGDRVIFVIDVPELPFFPHDCVTRPFGKPVNCTLARSAVDLRQRGIRRVIAELSRELPGLEVFDPLPVLCGDGDCEPLHAGHAFYKDSHHLSLRGSRLVAAALLRQIEVNGGPG